MLTIPFSVRFVMLASKKKPTAPKGASVMTMDEIRRIRQQTESGKQVDGVIISQNELERIRKSTKITS